VSVAVGFGITLKPFSSLRVLVALVAIAFVVVGIGELSSARSRFQRWGGIAWIAAGIAVAVWSGLTVHGLAIFAGASLLIGGLLRVLGAIRGDVEERWMSALSGLARAIFGVLALSWPDVTVLVLSLLVGPAMILFGLGQIGAALRFRDRRQGREHRRWPRPVRFVGVLGLRSRRQLSCRRSSARSRTRRSGRSWAPTSSLPTAPTTRTSTSTTTSARPPRHRARDCEPLSL
jgi:uncharacterized membrane protein HdeD (DUF308 family)